MGAPFLRHAGGALLLILCFLPAACGERPAPPPAEPAPAQPTGPVEPAAGPAPTARPSEEAIDAALRALEGADRTARRASVAVLLRGAHTHREIAHLALRAARLDRDVGLLADLLSDHAEGALPYVLHRITHAAAIQRGQICRALGRSRPDTAAAIAVLMVRALLDPEVLVRAEARLALAGLNPSAVEVVRAHHHLFGSTSDGSVPSLSASLLLGAGNLGADTPYGRALGLALAANAERFGRSTALAVDGYEAELSGAPRPWDDRYQGEPSSWHEEDVRMAEHLAASYSDAFGTLIALLERPRYLRPVALAFGMIGPAARDEARHVVAAWRGHLLGNMCEPDAPAATAPRILDRDNRWRRGNPRVCAESAPSVAAAWALVSLGNRSEEVQDGLWSLLALDLRWYDRDLVEAALKVLRPSGALVPAMLDALLPGSADSVWAARRASARAVLPWSHDDHRDAIWGRIRVLMDENLTRPERVALRGVLNECERLGPDPDGQVRRLIEALRLYAFSLRGQ